MKQITHRSQEKMSMTKKLMIKVTPVRIPKQNPAIDSLISSDTEKEKARSTY